MESVSAPDLVLSGFYNVRVLVNLNFRTIRLSDVMTWLPLGRSKQSSSSYTQSLMEPYGMYTIHRERILGSKLTCPMNRRTHPEKKWSFKAPMSLNSGKSRLVWWVEVDATLGMGGQKCRQGRHASHWCRTNSSSLLNTEFF